MGGSVAETFFCSFRDIRMAIGISGQEDILWIQQGRIKRHLEIVALHNDFSDIDKGARKCSIYEQPFFLSVDGEWPKNFT